MIVILTMNVKTYMGIALCLALILVVWSQLQQKKDDDENPDNYNH